MPVFKTSTTLTTYKWPKSILYHSISVYEKDYEDCVGVCSAMFSHVQPCSAMFSHVGLWDYGTMGLWDYGTMEFYKPKNLQRVEEHCRLP